MRHKRGVVLLSMLCLVLASTTAFSEDWTVLGERTVNFRDDVVMVPLNASGAMFSRVKLSVSRNYLELETVTVVFTNGESFEAVLDQYVAPGRSSKEIALPAPQSIARVEFTYRNASANKKLALVKVLGAT